MAIRYLLHIGETPDYRLCTTVRDPTDPSNTTYPDGLGSNIKYDARLEVPSVNKKISDAISGSIILGQLTLNVMNNDGKYDDVESLGWFNSPVTLLRSDKDFPILTDFQTIMTGTLDYPIVSQTTVQLKINNEYRSLTEDVCKTFSVDDYPNIPDSTEDSDIPIGYGPGLKNVPLFQIDSTDDTKYLILDPDYLVSVDAVYDSDGNSISFTGPDASGIITATDADSADVAGATSNRIGEIITNEIALKSGILYNGDNWDLIESNLYLADSAQLNFYFDGGTVRQLVDACLKSDNAFLFRKNNGLFTLRQWGRNYGFHELQSTKITKWPKKDYKDALTYYNSLAVIEYDKNQGSGDYENQRASGISPQFDKEKTAYYETDLYQVGEVQDLADRMIKRFGIISEIVQIYTGQPVVDIDLLDEIELDININGRQFSDKTSWIVREVDPAQDILKLEAKSGFVTPDTIDGVLGQIGFQTGSILFIDGVLSQALYVDASDIRYDGVLAQPLIVTGESV